MAQLISLYFFLKAFLNGQYPSYSRLHLPNHLYLPMNHGWVKLAQVNESKVVFKGGNNEQSTP